MNKFFPHLIKSVFIGLLSSVVIGAFLGAWSVDISEYWVLVSKDSVSTPGVACAQVMSDRVFGWPFSFFRISSSGCSSASFINLASLALNIAAFSLIGWHVFQKKERK